MATITTMAPTASPSSLKITTKLASLPPTSTYFSLEFFPPKTGMGMSNLRARLDRMSRALRPLFITVTWGAGGSTSAKSLELAELTQVDLGITTCLHLTCTNMSRALVDEALEGAKRLGVRNILALRGDPPREEYGDGDSDKKGSEEEGDEEELLWAVDLVRYIRKKYGDYFCIGVAAYPEGHADSSHPEVQSLEHDLPYLVEKVRTGADFIMTQLFYDVDAYKAFEETLRSHESGTFKTIPIIPGLMPIQSYQILKRTTKLSHAKVPDAILERLDEVKGDDEAVKRMGVDVMSEIVEKVKDMEETCPGPRGFHFYTLNLEKAVAFILERTGLVPDKSVDEEAVDDLEDCVPRIALNGVANIVNSTHPAKKTRRQSSVGGAPHNHVIVEKVSGKVFETTGAEAAVPKEKVNTRANTLAISEGEGTLGREATWDE
jgi:methylenetetrahydrofolate reductase (NADPH)